MKRTFPFVTGGLGASSEDDSDDSSLDSSFFPFVPSSRLAYTRIYEKEPGKKKDAGYH